MRDVVPAPPPLVHNQFETVKELFNKHVMPTYARFDIAFSHGQGSYVWDVRGKRYLDMGGGIAVNALGHANAEITETLIEQSKRLTHVSNLYYNEPQGRLAQRIVKHLAPGKVFFCNSGAEADEGLFKLARKFGHDEGRFEIITATNSFHGRTLAGISATGQEKVKKGFEPMVQGFRHVPYNDLDAVKNAISPATVAVLIEGVQGEGGITPATPEYLLGLRALCDERKMLLMIDAVQCGHFRTGRYQSFQRILEGVPDGEQFLPDAVSMAKALGGGFPIGAFWVREPHQDLLGAGTHGTTFGGTPLACAVALKVFDVIERDRLDENARTVGEFLKSELQRIARTHPTIIKNVRGLGFMIGIEFGAKSDIPALATNDKAVSLQIVNGLHDGGVLTVPSGTQVVRLLPPMNLRMDEAKEAIAAIGILATSLS
jgi:acetylornithine/N-succinyldiaminopimelate aminotransferase